MANHSSAKKATRQIEKRTLVNKSRITRIRTFIKKVLETIGSGKKEEAQKALETAQSEIMRGVKKNLIKKNTGSRKVSRLAKKVKEMKVS